MSDEAQSNVRSTARSIVDAETARLGVHDHVCELQLGLAQINELKTTGGHHNYRKLLEVLPSNFLNLI